MCFVLHACVFYFLFHLRMGSSWIAWLLVLYFLTEIVTGVLLTYKFVPFIAFPVPQSVIRA